MIISPKLIFTIMHNYNDDYQESFVLAMQLRVDELRLLEYSARAVKKLSIELDDRVVSVTRSIGNVIPTAAYQFLHVSDDIPCNNELFHLDTTILCHIMKPGNSPNFDIKKDYGGPELKGFLRFMFWPDEMYIEFQGDYAGLFESGGISYEELGLDVSRLA